MAFRWILLPAAAVAVALLAAGALTGDAVFLAPTAVIAVLIVGFVVAERLLSRRVMERHGQDADAAAGDHQESIPSAHVITDEETALGDTREAHSEVNPHDFPKGHPGRNELERQAGAQGGTSRGDESLLHERPRRDERLEDAPGKREGLEDER